MYAVDDDEGENGMVVYGIYYDNKFTSTTPEFSINPLTGVITGRVIFDREKKDTYVVRGDSKKAILVSILMFLVTCGLFVTCIWGFFFLTLGYHILVSLHEFDIPNKMLHFVIAVFYIINLSFLSNLSLVNLIFIIYL